MMSKGRHIHKGKTKTYEDLWAEYQAALTVVHAAPESLSARAHLASLSDELLTEQGYGS